MPHDVYLSMWYVECNPLRPHGIQLMVVELTWLSLITTLDATNNTITHD